MEQDIDRQSENFFENCRHSARWRFNLMYCSPLIKSYWP